MDLLANWVKIDENPSDYGFPFYTHKYIHTYTFEFLYNNYIYILGLNELW